MYMYRCTYAGAYARIRRALRIPSQGRIQTSFDSAKPHPVEARGGWRGSPPDSKVLSFRGGCARWPLPGAAGTDGERRGEGATRNPLPWAATPWRGRARARLRRAAARADPRTSDDELNQMGPPRARKRSRSRRAGEL